MLLTDGQAQKCYRKIADIRCKICGENVFGCDDFVYIKTKRKSEFVLHKRCMNIKTFNTDKI